MVTTFTTFTTSCVQGDLYDLYEDDGWFFPRSKISKDIAADLYAALEYVSSSSIHSGDNECFAHALWCYGGGSVYDKREIIGKKLYGETNSLWPVSYMYAVHYGNGVPVTLTQEREIILSAVGLEPVDFFNYSESAIIGLNNNHLAVFEAYDYEYVDGELYLWGYDQDGRNSFQFTKLDSAYQPD
ncbi:MAG TPA: hypothetical protein VFC94_05140 [Bacteroidaceae bacterium]|nr:hypothetical protein [Bacteroidaceae bacterium]